MPRRYLSTMSATLYWSFEMIVPYCEKPVTPSPPDAMKVVTLRR